MTNQVKYVSFRSAASWSDSANIFCQKVNVEVPREYITGIAVTLAHTDDAGVYCAYYSADAHHPERKARILNVEIVRSKQSWADFNGTLQTSLSNLKQSDIVGISYTESPRDNHQECIAFIWHLV